MGDGRTTDDLMKIQEGRTARCLAIIFTASLIASYVLQQLVLAALTLSGHENSIPVFEHLFNGWLPVNSGLAGSAVTYYLTRRPQPATQKAMNRGRASEDRVID